MEEEDRLVVTLDSVQSEVGSDDVQYLEDQLVEVELAEEDVVEVDV